MDRYVVLSLVSLLSLFLTTIPVASAQSTGTVTGRVTEAENDAPLPGVNVVLPALDRGAATDKNGRFTLQNVPTGSHRLEARFVGYATATRTVDVTPGSTTQVSITLTPESVDMTGIQVTALRPGMEPKTSLQAEQIRKAEVADPGALLREMPGVGSARRGPIGLAPNVRGLMEAEVGVYVNGMRTFPAGPARMDSPMSHIDPSTIAGINVVKGPYALTWGPGNMSAIRVQQRGEDPPPTSLTGTVRTGYDTNLGATEATAFAMGRQGRWFYSANAAWRQGDNYETGSDQGVPADFESTDGRGRIGVELSEHSTLSVNGSYQKQDNLDYPGRLLNAKFFETGMGQLKYSFASETGILRSLDIQANAQQTLHEMDNKGKPTYEAGKNRPPLRIGVQSEIQNFSGRVAADLTFGTKWDVTVGGDVLHTYRDAIRTLKAAPPNKEPFVPPFYKTANGTVRNRAWPDVTISQQGAFVKVQRPVGEALTLTATSRLDRMQSDADAPLQPFLDNTGTTEAAMDRQDTRLSGALTASVPLAAQWSLSLGVGSVARPPTALERYAHQFPANKSQTSAEFLGTPSLEPERSTQADLWIEGTGRNWSLSINGFARHLDDYITFEPAPSVDPILPLSPPTVFRYVNGTANFVGGEVSAAVSPMAPLTLRASGSVLWGRDETLDEPAFGVAPPSAALGARWSPSVDLPRVSEVYVDGAVNLMAEQDRVARTRKESPTDGYTTADLRVGAQFLRRINLKVGVENLFDVAYSHHLNAKNPFSDARIPEPGRVISTTLTVAF
ncbi:MAG: TonB-dependent receptor [Salinibacter sp.]|uniref:TonB-dependent receptor n=1 Tax=Salinibacter sp. TaxID=2065818 RepID=UPI0035D4FEE2